MGTIQVFLSVIVFGISIFLLILSIKHFCERGYLLNNAYIHASKQQRESMDKRPYYRQSAIVLILLSVVFFIIGLSVVFENYIIELLEIPVIMFTLIYAVVSSQRINNTKK